MECIIDLESRGSVVYPLLLLSYKLKSGWDLDISLKSVGVLVMIGCTCQVLPLDTNISSKYHFIRIIMYPCFDV